MWLFYITNYGPDLVHLSHQIQALQRSSPNLDRFRHVGLRAGFDGPRPADRAQRRRLSPARLSRDRRRPGADRRGYVQLFSSATTAKTKTWTESNRIFSANGNLQPAPVQITDNYLIAYCRPGGDFEPNTRRFVIRSESRDGGNTWTKGENSQFPNPNSAIDFIKLAKWPSTGLVFNDTNVDDRMPLTVAISTDNDRSYPHRRNIVNKPGDTAAYPVAIQTRDGKIHVIYTSENRQVVNRATFDESAILGHKP